MHVGEKERLLDTISSLDAAVTNEQALGIYTNYASRFGLTKFLVSQIVNPLSEEAPHAMMHSNWPTPILENRFAGMNLLHDPVVQYGMQSRFPFLWAEAYRHASKYGRQLMDSARDFHLDEGITFPMRRPGAPLGGISLGGDHLDLSDDDKSALELASLHCYSKLEELHPPYPVQELRELSPQEKDVLQFATAGKTSWETGVIMQISESAVKDALRRAREKLDAVNTLHACTKAISRDLIIP